MKKIVNVMKSKTYQIPSLIFNNYKKLKISEKELIILIYVYNNQDKEYNPKNISNDLSLKVNTVLESINSLEEKGLLEIQVYDNHDIRETKINLDLLYEKCAYILEDNNETSDVFSKYEKELGRSLSPIEYEIINKWLEEQSEELILLALKEAIYNGTNNFRYIDRIIYEWNKKGIKTEKDIIENRKEFKKKQKNQELFDYDWLNEESNN